MKKFTLHLLNRFNNSINIISRKYFMNTVSLQTVHQFQFLPYFTNINHRKNSYMKNIVYLHKSTLALIASLLFTFGSLSAQVINEGFEETEWQGAFKNPNNSGTTSGSVVINATSANSTMIYYTAPSSSTSSYSMTVTSTGTGTKSTGSTKFTSTLTSTGLNTSPNSGTWWYSRANSGTDTKLQKAHSALNSLQLSSGGYVITPIISTGIATVTFWASPAGKFFIGANTATANPTVQGYSSNSSNNGYTYGVSTYPANGTQGNSYMQSFTYSTFLTNPAELGVFNASGNSIYIDDIAITLNQGTQATVTTGSSSSLTYTTATVSGTITANSPSPNAVVISSGICFSTSVAQPDTSGNFSTDGPVGITSGSISSLLSNLTPKTHYYARAYAITTAGIIYGSTTTEFTTLAPTKPSLTTDAVSNILSNKATGGGNISDSGGLVISQRGVCWSTTSGTETATSGINFTKDGVGSGTFSSLIKSLQPLTTYYVMAYAINSLGITYGNEISFTTAVAGPVIIATPNTINFPTTTLNSTPKILTDTIKGTFLSPATGNVTIAISDTNFLMSTSLNGVYSDTIVLPYIKGTFDTVIYIKEITNNYASNTSTITFSIPGVTNLSSDNIVLNDNIVPDPNVLTNLGTEFWVGHGLEEHMGSKNAYGLQVYIATGAQSATAKVSIPGIPSFAPQYFTIAPNTVQIVSGFPTGDGTANNKSGTADARLYYTGISNRAIHVEVTNNVPVAVFLYDYATNNSAGGSMVFPTNTWNSSYIVQTYGGASTNTGIPNTYFFVMAKENNTKVIFKPTAQILDSASSPIITGQKVLGSKIAYDVNTSDTIILNKGQVFNAIGLVDISTKVSNDLTGTLVSSDCSHPIAVFAGNSRTLINAPGLSCFPNSGSDNLIQQMFPKVAWGTKYLTVPTKTMEYNLFRIGVGDTTTVVTVDDSILDKSKLNTTGLFYEIEGNTCKKIQSNKPITVTQFILPGSACGGAVIGNSGTGDPEMILLSPVQQSIKSTTVYASDFKDGASGGAYINVVIPTSGVSSFRLDIDTANNPLQYVDTGASSYPDTLGISHAYAPADTLIPIANAFRPFPQDPTYSWAKFHVSYPGIHTMSASVGFNAIAYGVANGESWGYNAGTKIVDLTTHISTNTPYGHSQDSLAGTTCKGNTTWINISLPYDSSTVQSMEWKSDNDPSIIPANFDTSVNKPVAVDHFVQAGVTYYTYKSPINYTFNNLGTYNFTVTVYGTFANDCGGSQTIKVPMIIGKDITDFSYLPASCGDSTYNFKNTTNTFSSAKDSMVIWTFPTATDTLFNTTKKRGDTAYTFPFVAANNPTNRTVKLRSINSIGCFSDTVKTFPILVAPKPVAAFSLRDSICLTDAETFTNNTDLNYTAKYGKTPTYKWDFGDNNSSTSVNPTHQYQSSGTYIAKLTATSAKGCDSSISHLIAVVTPPTPSHITSLSTNTTNSLLIGEQITLTDNVKNGIWGNTDNRLVAMDSSSNIAKVTGLSKGLDTIYYIQPARICSSDTAIYPLHVEPSIVYMPNLFTPDGDGHNDLFYVRGSTTLYKDVELWVFSSWGNQVFHRKGAVENPNDGWDGNFNGKAQPSGVYVWVAKLTGWNGNIVTQKGSVTLIR